MAVAQDNFGAAVTIPRGFHLYDPSRRDGSPVFAIVVEATRYRD